MKIYSPKHNIRETQTVNLKDIPLCFTNTDDTEYKVDITLEDKFAANKSIKITPFYEFTEEDPYLFNENNDFVEDIILKRYGTTYVYEPIDGNEFVPETFSTNALIKKKLKYRNDKNYDIKVGVIENGISLDISSKLISIFGDANKRGICPPNITINSGSMIPQSLVSNFIKDVDILFIKSKNGSTITTDSDGKLIIDYDDLLLKKHTNIWLLVEDFEECMSISDRLFPITENLHLGENIDNPCLYSKNNDYYINNEKKIVFIPKTVNSLFPESDYSYYIYHPSVLILERKNGGYVIVTHNSILNNLKSAAKLIYETIMYTYLNSYYLTEYKSSWITDDLVDYTFKKSTKYTQRHEKIKLNDLVPNLNYDEYDLINIFTTNENVKFMNLNSNNELEYYKIFKTNDIPKDINEISYLTSKSTVINYKPILFYLIDKPIDITYEVNDNNIFININSIINSSNRVYIKDKVKFEITDYNNIYYICTTKGNRGKQNILSLIDSKTYDQLEHGMKLATIKIYTETKMVNYDIRINGGGLPESSEDNYNMIDIGHPYGRPYRIGGTTIIKLPSSLKVYRDKIEPEVKKHIAGGDYPIFVYE